MNNVILNCFQDTSPYLSNNYFTVLVSTTSSRIGAQVYLVIMGLPDGVSRSVLLDRSVCCNQLKDSLSMHISYFSLLFLVRAGLDKLPLLVTSEVSSPYQLARLCPTIPTASLIWWIRTILLLPHQIKH